MPVIFILLILVAIFVTTMVLTVKREGRFSATSIVLLVISLLGVIGMFGLLLS